MADSLEAFFGQLGETFAPQSNVSDCGCSLGASQDAIDASLAINRVLAQYTLLMIRGTALQKIAARKVQIPCEVWNAYANARQDYLTKAQELFDQLTAKGITVEQVLYSGASPKLDPRNPARAATARLLTPLRPPAFVGLGQQCPGVADMSGASTLGNLGWERTPIQLASVPLSSLRPLGQVSRALILISDTSTVIGLAAPTGYQTLKKVAVAPRPFVADALQAVTAYTTCFEAQGSNPDAAQRCTPASAARSRRSLEIWGLLGISAIVLFMGGVIVRSFRQALMAGADEDVRSRPGDPIFLGDLYWQPRGRKRLGRI